MDAVERSGPPNPCDLEPVSRPPFTILDRLRSWTWPVIYKMVPIQLGLLIPLVLFIALLARQVDQVLGLPALLFQPLGAVIGVLLLGVSAVIVYWAYSHLALEGDGSPNPNFRQTSRIVMNGPYALVRHPTVIGKVIGVVGVAFLFQALTFLGFVVPILLAGAVVSYRRSQEVPLEEEEGGVYRQYRERVPMFFPSARDMLGLAKLARPVLVSAALLIAAVCVAGPSSFGWRPSGAGLAGLLAAGGLLLLPLAARTAQLRHTLPDTPLWQRLGHACGLDFTRHLMHLEPGPLRGLIEDLLGQGSGRVVRLLARDHAARAWFLGTLFLPAGLCWSLLPASPSLRAAGVAGVLVLSTLGWRFLGTALQSALSAGAPAGVDAEADESGGPGSAVAVSTVLELAAVIGAWAVLYQVVGVPVPLVEALAVFPVVVLLAGLRSSYDGLGVVDVALILLLGLLGVEPAMALTLSLLFHLVRLSTRVLSGFCFLLALSRTPGTAAPRG